MNIIGIDPGVTGGIALLNGDGSLVGVYDTPRIGKEMDGGECASLILELSKYHAICCIERVKAMPQQNVKSSETFMVGYGTWKGILYAFRIGFQEVPPQAWQKMDNLPRRNAALPRDGEDAKAYAKRKSKVKNEHLKALMSTAMKRWPLVEKWNDGRVAAAFIAEYGRRERNGGGK